MAIKKGDKVKLKYEGKFEDGEVFDSSAAHGDQPLEVEVGAGQVIKGFDSALEGMEVDEEKEIKLTPTEAYGEVRPELVQKVPKERLPPEAKEGATLVMKLPNGGSMPVQVKEMDDKEATLDMNHPLAGKTLIFKLKIVSIN